METLDLLWPIYKPFNLPNKSWAWTWFIDYDLITYQMVPENRETSLGQ